MIKMSEIVVVGGAVFLGSLAGSLTTLLIIKRVVNSDLIAEYIEDLLSDEAILQKAYMASGVIGQGFITGSGLKGVFQKQGKPKVKDIAIQMGLEWLGQIMNKNAANKAENQQQQTFNSNLTE